MTSATMLTRLRTLLDEASAGLWADSECYSALADGQNEVISQAIAKHKVKGGELPKILREVVATTTGSGTTTLPSDFLYPISVIATLDSTPIFIRPYVEGRDHAKQNTYLISSTTSPYCSFNSIQLVMETSLAWSLDYIKTPTEIASGTNPLLDVTAHNAIVQYAFAFLLKKDEDPRADSEFNKFYNLVQSIV